MSSKNSFVAMALALCALIAAGGLLASNMAFKLNVRLTEPGPGNGQGKQLLALPYLRQKGINSALDLILDIGGGVVTPVASVSKYNKSVDLYTTFTGRMSANNPFSLVAGDGYLVQMVSDVNYVIVGAHDPSLSIALTGPGPGSLSGKQLFAPPYNATVMDAFQLMLDIGGGVITPVSSVSKYDKSHDLFVSYTGRMGAGVPFAIIPGEAYLVQMAANVPYIASHY